MTDPVAIVTGAAGALGGEVARVLSRRGYKLIVADADRARQRLESLAVGVGGATILAGDLTAEATWAEGLSRAEREAGAPSSVAALVAGGWLGGAPLYEERSDDVWRTMLAANLETAYRAFRALLPGMVARRHGSIVVVGSRAAALPSTSARAAAYAASKAALVALAQAVAAEVLEHGVRVNAVLPSTLDTPANRASMPRADASRWVPLSSAADVIAFLLSDGARDVSGVALPVYGRA